MVLWVVRMANETEHHLQKRLGTEQNQPVTRSLVDLFEMMGRHQHNRSDVRCLTEGHSNKYWGYGPSRWEEIQSLVSI